MQKWEYRFRYFKNTELGVFEHEVQALGSEGWELVQIIWEQGHRPIDWQGELPVAIFKRPIGEHPAAFEELLNHPKQ